MDQGDLLFFLVRTLLCAKRNDIVPFVVREHRLKVKILRLTCMVPSDSHDFKTDLASDKVALDILVVRRTLCLSKELGNNLRWDQVAS